ncbi:hypothetical protein BsWGS_08655 [Bradybaena similaris]
MTRSQIFPRTIIWICFCIVKIVANDCPQPCTCEGALNLTVVCSNLQLTTVPVTSPNTLTLDLSNNSLGPIINSTLVQMRHLTSLDLSSNGLTRLLGCTFIGMLQLTTVRLRGNRLTVLPDSLFADINKLEYLDVSFNLLTEIPDLVFRNTPELRFLDVSNNLIGQFKLGAGFQVPRKIHIIDASHNHIETLRSNAFEEAGQWENIPTRSLSLAHCRLSTVEDAAFAGIPNLNHIDLSGNGALVLASLSATVKSLESKGLERLSLTFMNLTTIDSLFTDVTQLSLKFLNVSFNSISNLPANVFTNVKSLEVLDLSRNSMSTLTGGFSDLDNLKVLNISGNRLEDFHGDAVTHFSNVHTLDVSGNRLSESRRVDLSTLSNLRYLSARSNSLNSAAVLNRTSLLQHLDFSYNRISEFSGLETAVMLEIVDFSNNELRTLPGLLFKGAKFLKLVNFSNNFIENLDHGAFIPQSSLVIDLSHNLLTELRYCNWAATQRLYVKHNKLTNINSQAFYNMNGLEELDLSHNKLTSLHEDLLQYLINLRHLNLSHNWLDKIDWFVLFRSLELVVTLDIGYNNITHLGESFFLPLPKVETVSIRNNRLQTVIPETFKEVSHVKCIDLSNNPFDCSCDGLAFRDWLKQTKVPILELYNMNSSAYHCHTPPSRAGVHVIHWSPGEFECDQSILYIIAFCSTFIFLTFLGLASAGIHRLCRNRRNRKREAKRAAELEEEESRRAKKIEFVRLSNYKQADEKKLGGHKRQEFTNRRNGYVPWPGGAQKQQRDRSRSYNGKDSDKERILQDDNAVEEERESGGERHYEKLKRREWAAEDAERQRRRDRDERPHRHTVVDGDGGDTRDRSDERPRGQMATEGSNQQHHFHTTGRIPSHSQDFARDRPQAIEHGRFLFEDPRFREGPYIISTKNTFRNRWESPPPWDQHETRANQYYLKPKREGQQSDSYTANPQMDRDMIRHGRVTRARDRISSNIIHHHPLEVHFDDDTDPRPYPRIRSDAPKPSYYIPQRSRSYHYLPEEYLVEVPLVTHDLGQRQYESLEPPRRIKGMGHRAVSQPYIVQPEGSAWL